MESEDIYPDLNNLRIELFLRGESIREEQEYYRKLAQLNGILLDGRKNVTKLAEIVSEYHKSI